MSERATAEQIALLRRFAIDDAAGTQLGGVWLQRLSDHGPELRRLYATQPRLQEQADRALARAAALVESQNAEPPPVVDDEVISVIEAAFAELRERGSSQMRDVTDEARDDLRAFRGKSVREILQTERSGR